MGDCCRKHIGLLATLFGIESIDIFSFEEIKKCIKVTDLNGNTGID